MDARGGPRSPSWFELVGVGMGESGEDTVADLCDKVADLIEQNPGYVVRVARRLATAMRPAAVAVAK